MTRATRGFRLHVGLLGRRNVGKSSLINALARQDVAIVSPTPGTTTDPVSKPMEIQPLGPVVFIDTAGLDDPGALGALRVARTRRMLDRLDVALLVAAGRAWDEREESLLADLRGRGTPVIAVFNQSDKAAPDPALLAVLRARGVPCVSCSALRGDGLDDLRAALTAAAPDRLEDPALLRDLVPAGGTCVLVVPIDAEAPKGRLILPQVHALRDLLDGHAVAVVCRETELAGALANLRRPPDLVVTDSQAFREVAAVVPDSVPLTGFSVLMARLRGDLTAQTAGARVIGELRPGDRVLVAEACSHHPVQDDIGRVKLPRWLDEAAGGPLRYTTVQGHDFPDDLTDYRLVVHCGACTLNRSEVRRRLERCAEAGVPVTNYGLAIAWRMGILERATAMF
ncbi:MAG TPA: [FeFe] hydrogenase H-cluster maturation GTPase HydF [Candidatus Krumholzibacteria bacterium]|nr:[FeFe] hydrogenase H-cluster maturation GTPase HydF [Candidatus Krumholzibacteria bacterium]HRX52446.1 [FeFe] hydrogenase H-cluster maturation GTPase HydF [Candidatus Krumholzibacteria bacterium]